LVFLDGEPKCYVWGGDSPVISYKRYVEKIRRRKKAKEAYLRHLKKSVIRLETLAKRLGIRIGRSERRILDYDRESRTLQIPIDCELVIQKYYRNYFVNPDVEIFKLVLVSDDVCVDVALMGRDEIGQIWLHHLPTFGYALAGIETCERWLLGISKWDVVVQQT
ncbi:MAG: hypothetical protein ACTSV7_09035, partial [Candidatus Baldrarchaeia archaeon]